MVLMYGLTKIVKCCEENACLLIIHCRSATPPTPPPPMKHTCYTWIENNNKIVSKPRISTHRNSTVKLGT